MSTASLAPIGAHDHVLGGPDAAVTLVEYGNYECLHCRRAYPFTEELRRDFGDRLRFVYRHFAIPADFPNAERAAEAAEAAAAQGRFWDMHERLFAGEPLLYPEALLYQAEALGLDLDRFRSEVSASVHRPRVRADLEEGLAAGVRETPTFFLNGVRIQESWDLDGVRAAVERVGEASG